MTYIKELRIEIDNKCCTMAAVKMPILFGAILVLQVVTALNGTTDVLNGNEYAIVGGEDANIINFPYQLSLRFNGGHVCGAAVISSLWALSAAHCINRNVAPSLYSLLAGSSRRDSGAVYAVQRIVVHAQYNRATIDFDISAIQTARPFQFSPVIRPIALDPVTTDFPPQTFCVITGWGQTGEGRNPPLQLQSAVLRTIPRADCLRILNNLTDRMICAGAEANGRGACFGDSGSPMAFRGRLVGLASFIVGGCGSRQYPSVYTSIRACRGWIRAVTRV